jgi:hypothetical protein
LIVITEDIEYATTAIKAITMSAINKKQMKSLMTEVKDGRILKKVLSDVEKGCLFCYNQSFKSIIILYNLEKKHNIKSDRSDHKEQIARILSQRNIILGRKEEKKIVKRSSFTYDADPSYFIRRRERKNDWNKRIAEMARYEAMGALWNGTPLCEDVIGEIMSYL